MIRIPHATPSAQPPKRGWLIALTSCGILICLVIVSLVADRESELPSESVSQQVATTTGGEDPARLVCQPQPKEFGNLDEKFAHGAQILTVCSTKATLVSHDSDTDKSHGARAESTTAPQAEAKSVRSTGSTNAHGQTEHQTASSHTLQDEKTNPSERRVAVAHNANHLGTSSRHAPHNRHQPERHTASAVTHETVATEQHQTPPERHTRNSGHHHDPLLTQKSSAQVMAELDAGSHSGKALASRTAGTVGSASSEPASSSSNRKSVRSRSRTEVERLINEVGRTPPDWFDATPLTFPSTLDLSWPQPPPKGWNNKKNVGQFIWDIINPNPNRWHEGVRFLHHLLSENKDRRDVLLRVMNELGRMYHDMLADYARAAFWWRQAGADKNPKFSHGRSGAHLAECYWRLGSESMAVELLNRLPLTYASIKLWGDLGELHRATQLTEAAVRGGGVANRLYLTLGDAYRSAGKYDQAVLYYRKVLRVRAFGKRKEHIEQDHQRAQSSIAAIQAIDALDLKRIPDGTYQANTLGYAGQIYVAVSVRAGRIESVRVTRHKEKQFYSALSDTPNKIVEKQGLKGVDATSSATITSEAIINATAKALFEAME